MLPGSFALIESDWKVPGRYYSHEDPGASCTFRRVIKEIILVGSCALIVSVDVAGLRCRVPILQGYDDKMIISINYHTLE